MKRETTFLIGGVIAVILLFVLFFSILSASEKRSSRELRLGFFPNIQHSQALVGLSKNFFQKELGEDMNISTKVFNAGPSVIEAMFAGELDIAYIGPNPSINGFTKSNGTALRVIAGATSGGAAFVVRDDSGIRAASDLKGKKFASPQLGNTQDVALRFYLKKNGLETVENGGDVQVIPTQNPDILSLFLKKEIDGAWVPEPWATRLVQEGGGVVLVDERDLWPDGKFVTANIIVSTKFLRERPDVVKKFLKAHVETTQWINANKAEAIKITNERIKELTGKALPQKVIEDAFTHLEVTYDPVKNSLFESANAAFELGFLGKTKPDLTGIYDLTLLNEVLQEKGLAQIN
ncbi:MAG: ABC transporter substrate-binding protein [Candidatus Norongarragalinales archaeon]